MALEQVDELYEAVSSARKSTNFVLVVKFSQGMEGRSDGDGSASVTEVELKV